MVDHGGFKESRWLVDELGTFWSEQSLELREKLFCLHYAGDLATDIIRNLGYIGVRSSRTGLHLRLHSLNLAEAAVIAVLYWIADNSTETTLIEYLDDDRPNEILRGPAAAIDRISAINKSACLNRRISVEHADITRMSNHSQLRGLVSYWRERSGCCEPAELERLANETANGRYIRIKYAENDQFIVRKLGVGLEIPEPQWSDVALDKPVGTNGDQIYFDWVLSTYSAAWKSGRPDFAEVKATILWPTKGRVQRHYERLLLPCTDPCGSRYLLSANGRPSGDTRLFA